eukprot:NODE_280_length_11906_cov_0.405268.p9 type:complete len:175 gc:universal NODE_280_length_11906_cov_0.405268:7131-7655(+)
MTCRLISFSWLPLLKKYLYHYYSLIFRFYKPVYIAHHYSLQNCNKHCIPEEALYNGYRIMQNGFIISSDRFIEYMNTRYPSFECKYKVYKHFIKKGFLVYSGLNFAVDYVLYTDARSKCHSSYGVLVEPAYRYFDLFRAQRVVHHVRKKLILCYFQEDELFSVKVQRFTISGHR